VSALGGLPRRGWWRTHRPFISVLPFATATAPAPRAPPFVIVTDRAPPARSRCRNGEEMATRSNPAGELLRAAGVTRRDVDVGPSAHLARETSQLSAIEDADVSGHVAAAAATTAAAARLTRRTEDVAELPALLPARVGHRVACLVDAAAFERVGAAGGRVLPTRVVAGGGGRKSAGLR